MSEEWVVTAAHCFNRWVDGSIFPQNNRVDNPMISTATTPVPSALIFCVFSSLVDVSMLLIRLGALDRTDDDEWVIRRNASELFKHEGFANDKMFDNDIALVKLDEKVTEFTSSR